MMNTIRVRIPANGHSLYTEIHLPKTAGEKPPVVVCSHGFGSSAKLVRGLIAKALVRSGFAAVCFDFYGGSTRSRSGGQLTEMSVFTEKDDLNAVIDYVKMRGELDSSQLYLFGESQGGFVTAITAAERSREIRGVVEYYPAFCIPYDARKHFLSVDEIPDEYRHMGRTLGKIYCEKLLDYQVYEVIAAYEGPVLIVHGTKDPVVDISWSRKARTQYKHAELVEISGAGHGFFMKNRKRAAEETVRFLNANRITQLCEM